MKTVQIVQLLMAIPKKGETIKDAMTELLRASDGKLAMNIEWQGVVFSKKARFVFCDDVIAARVATQEEVQHAAKKGGSSMARARTPGGMLVQTLAGLAGELSHSGKGQSGVVLQYRNPKGHMGAVIVVAGADEVAEIMQAIPADRIVAPAEPAKQS